MKESFDVIVVGAGPAGISAACVLADAGIKTIVIERGEFPGAKNVSGGVLYGHNLAAVLPDYIERGCPVERNIVESRLWLLSADGGVSLGVRDRAFSGDLKYNAFTVGRARFDRWFAEQAVLKGALVVPGTVVEDLIRDKSGAVCGVLTGREDGEIKARAVILADGVNSPLAARAGFRPEVRPEHVALSVKEIIELTPEVINERFGVTDREGVTTEILGSVTNGMDGVAVLYTNHSSLSLAIGANLADLSRQKTRPYEMLEDFKQHPMVAQLIDGGKPVEYLAHWLAEGGYDSIPQLYGDGYVIAGDSAMLFNAPHREGNNLAMVSGQLAAETVIEALKRGDTSRRNLAAYSEALRESFVMADMKKYRRFGKFLQHHPEIFSVLPGAVAEAGRELLTVNGVAKREKQKKILREFWRKLPLIKLARLLWGAWRAVK